nr:unnamed protein product [Spirometra erinaceieuropaei]
MSFTSISRKRLDKRRTTLVSVVFCHLRADRRPRRQEATSANFWQSAEPMRTARWGLAATAFRGAILVVGGVDKNGRFLNTVEMFTPPDAHSSLGQWKEQAGKQEPSCRFTLLTSSNAVFALGDAHSSLGQWKEQAGMQEPRCRFTLLTSSNAVFALGATNLDATIFKQLFLQWLPPSVQAILAPNIPSSTLQMPAETADRILEYYQPPVMVNVASRSTITPTIEDVVKRLDALTLEVFQLRATRVYNPRSPAITRRPRSPTPNQPTVDGFCWYNHNYGSNSHRCHSPCGRAFAILDQLDNDVYSVPRATNITYSLTTASIFQSLQREFSRFPEPWVARAALHERHQHAGESVVEFQRHLRILDKKAYPEDSCAALDDRILENFVDDIVRFDDSSSETLLAKKNSRRLTSSSPEMEKLSSNGDRLPKPEKLTTYDDYDL